MQFKRQGRRVQVLAYRGYDKEKRRAIVKMMGSIDAYSYEPSDGLIENLTDEEKKELQSYIETERQAAEKRSRQYSAKRPRRPQTRQCRVRQGCPWVTRQKRQKAPPERFGPVSGLHPLPAGLYPRRGSPKAGGDGF